MLMSFPQPIFGQDTFFTLVQLFFTNAAHMPSIVMLLYRRCAGWVVIAFIQTQVLRLRLGHFGSIYNDGFNRFVQQFRIMDIGPCDDIDNGPPSRSVKMLFFEPFLPRSVGLAPISSPPNEPCPSFHRRLAIPNLPTPMLHILPPTTPKSWETNRCPPNVGTFDGS